VQQTQTQQPSAKWQVGRYNNGSLLLSDNAQSMQIRTALRRKNMWRSSIGYRNTSTLHNRSRNIASD
jgi:hypothetical protein